MSLPAAILPLSMCVEESVTNEGPHTPLLTCWARVLLLGPGSCILASFYDFMQPKSGPLPRASHRGSGSYRLAPLSSIINTDSPVPSSPKDARNLPIAESTISSWWTRFYGIRAVFRDRDIAIPNSLPESRGHWFTGILEPPYQAEEDPRL